MFYGHIKSLFIKSNLKKVLCSENQRLNPTTHTHTQKEPRQINIFFMMLQNQNALYQHLRIKIEFIIYFP